jgi:hypothetical protein
MELRDFIKTSLLDILGGIQDAATVVNSDGGLGAINPVRPDQIFRTEKVEFDIAVTAASESGGNVSGGINVYGAKIGSSIFGKLQDSKVSRLKFTIPVAMPAQVIET